LKEVGREGRDDWGGEYEIESEDAEERLNHQE
jgi:hypothetical protein